MSDNAVAPNPRRSGQVTGSQIDPFSAFRQQMDRLFDDFFAPGFYRAGTAAFTPALDYSETDKEVRVRAELPGVEEKDIDVSIDGPLLTIKGEKNFERNEDGENHRVVERSYGAFARSIRLPFEPKDADIAAQFKNGVLNIAVKKPAELAKSPKRIPIGKA